MNGKVAAILGVGSGLGAAVALYGRDPSIQVEDVSVGREQDPGASCLGTRG